MHSHIILFALAAACPADGGELENSFPELFAMDDECGDYASEACALAAFQLRATAKSSLSATEAEVHSKTHRAEQLQEGLQVQASSPASQTAALLQEADVSDSASSQVNAPLAATPRELRTHNVAGGSMWDVRRLMHGGLVPEVLSVFIVIFAIGAYQMSSRSWQQRQVKACKCALSRVQHVILRGDGDAPLCPWCVDFVDGASKSRVVFICGHCFHMKCANAFFTLHPDKVGACPVCVVPDGPAVEAVISGADPAPEERADAEATVANDSDGNVIFGVTSNAQEEAHVKYCGEQVGEEDAEEQRPPLDSPDMRRFMLESLHRKFPEMISQARVETWVACHPEVWPSDLDRPYEDVSGEVVTQEDRKTPVVV